MKSLNLISNQALSYGDHFMNNWSLTVKALKSAFYTFGHAITPRISGFRASQLHNEIWVEGRKASLQDLQHRLRNGLYISKEEALADYEAYSALYNEEPLMTRFIEEIEQHYSN